LYITVPIVRVAVWRVYIKSENWEDANSDSHWIRVYNLIDSAVDVKHVEVLLIKF